MSDRRDGIDETDDGNGMGEQSSADGLAERRGMDIEVYQPAEDSGLLAQAAVEYPVSGTVLEVGTGSGWVAQQVSENTDSRVLGSDINPHAARQARERGVEAARANLIAPFRDGSLDAVLFNPPYLPTDPDNEWDDWMEHALSGGESGRELIDPFLDRVGRVLAPDGVVLLLVSSLTGYEAVVERAESNGFSVQTAVQESYPFETLTVISLTK
jgi:release factor glutamine methyltransferase